jgi:hypothetical protein
MLRLATRSEATSCSRCDAQVVGLLTPIQLCEDRRARRWRHVAVGGFEHQRQREGRPIRTRSSRPPIPPDVGLSAADLGTPASQELPAAVLVSAEPAEPRPSGREASRARHPCGPHCPPSTRTMQEGEDQLQHDEWQRRQQQRQHGHFPLGDPSSPASPLDRNQRACGVPSMQLFSNSTTRHWI